MKMQAVSPRRTLCSCMLLLAALAAQSTAQCVTATATHGWVNTAFATQTGTFTTTFDATPSLSNMNSVVGLSHSAGAAYSDFANLVAFNGTMGVILARNGAAYASQTNIPYTGGSTYHFRLVVNIPAHTYSIFVTPPGGSELTIGSNFAFRTEQNTVTSLSNFGVFVGATAGSLAVCNFAISSGSGGTPDFSLSVAPPTSQTVTAGGSTSYRPRVKGSDRRCQCAVPSPHSCAAVGRYSTVTGRWSEAARVCSVSCTRCARRAGTSGPVTRTASMRRRTPCAP